jgi:hypothetical protein
MVQRLIKVAAAVALLFSMSLPAAAGTCNITNLPTSGTLTGSRLNARYSQIESCINGGIDENNLAANTNIPTGDLAAPNALAAHSFTLDCAAGTKAAAFVPMVSGTVVGMSTHVDATSTFEYAVVLKKNTSTIATDAGITTTTANLTSGLSTSVTTSDEVVIDITQTTAGTCTAVNVVVYLEYVHQS